ncbi:MAG: hypothetical protein WC756_18155 [Taibaiella sp.]
MTDRILRGWNFMRIVRLALGIFIIVQGIVTKEWAFALLGGLFTILPLLNIGCCGASGCSMPVSKNHKKSEDITYEEVL